MPIHDFSMVNTIGFDADDTLWVNETYFREAEEAFSRLLSDYETENRARQMLFEVEMQNLELYGYGIKGFVLSMVECALKVSNNVADAGTFAAIIELGKTLLQKPVEVLDGVEEVLAILSRKYRLLLLTKGDLLDQETKLKKSGLEKYFDHVEILSNKFPENYERLLKHLSVEPAEFLMIGNSVKSDVLPLLEIGAQAVHVPFHTTWEHEQSSASVEQQSFLGLRQLTQLVEYL